MDNLFVQKERHVLPNWRTFKTTVHSGELTGGKIKKITTPSINLSIDDYISTWEWNKTVPVAGDLISAAFVNGFVKNPIVKEAAAFILSKRIKSTNTILSLAESIINTSDIPQNGQNSLNIVDSIKPHNIHHSIKKIKNQIITYPLNPILYVELSRLYSILGYKRQAIQNMSIALHLVPENRFILRAASRLYVHFEELEYIHDLIKKSEIVKYDPWITSTEITLATMIKRRSSFLKQGVRMISSGDHSNFSITELASSIGTIELSHGDRKKTKQLLKTSLLSPNDNSLAQIEWILNKDNLFEFDPAIYLINHKHEAMTLDNYYKKKWDEALTNSIAWSNDLPFSKHPFLFGAHIADALIGNSEIAQELLIAALVSHHNDPQVINNLAYSLALQNRISEAEGYLNKIRKLSDIEEDTKICLTATKGLISYRKGLIEEGRNLYYEAINGTKSINNIHLNQLAILNYAREEILCKSKDINFIIDAIKKMPDKKYPDVDKLKDTVIEMYINSSKLSD